MEVDHKLAYTPRLRISYVKDI